MVGSLKNVEYKISEFHFYSKPFSVIFILLQATNITYLGYKAGELRSKLTRISYRYAAN